MAELGIPYGLQTPRSIELVFNDFTGSPTTLSGGTAAAMPAGAGLLVQDVQGLDGAGVRNPTTIKPFRSGAIVHTFHREPRIFTLSGLILGDTPADRVTVEDFLRGMTDEVVAADGRFLFKPSGQATRFLTVRCYDPVTIVGPGASAGMSPTGVAAPKLFTMSLIAGDWLAYTYTETDTTVPGDGTPTAVPNLGNTATYPTVEVYGPITTGFTLTETISGFSLTWSGSLASGDWIEINMTNETMYQNGSGSDLISGLNLTSSDFFSLPIGGGTLTLVGDADHALVKSNDAWV